MANLNDDDDDDELGLSRIEIVSAQQRNCYFQKVVKEWQNKRAIIIIIIVFSWFCTQYIIDCSLRL